MPTLGGSATIEQELLRGMDALVRARRFESRSEAIGAAVARELDHLRRTTLARECAKLSARSERRLAEQGLAADVATWPGY